MATLDPDLIVGIYSGMSEDEYKTLSQIAPTLVQSGAYVDWGMPWQEESRMIGRALGQSAQAETLIAAIEARVTEARAAHPEFGGAQAVIGQMGETEVCGTPRKVVPLGPHMLDLMLSLGVQPAGFAETQYINEEAFGKPVEQIAYLGPYVETMPINVGDRADPNLEVLALIKPDLILSELREEDQRALLQQIAPTIAFRGNRADEWQRTIEPVAQALNLPQEAVRVISEHEAYLAEKRAELAPRVAQFPRIMFVPQNQEGVLAIFTPNSWAGDLLVDLGFELVHLPGDDTSVNASVEIMPTLSTDLIIVRASGTATPELAEEMCNC